MPLFKVQCFERGVWDGIEPRDVEARSEQEAAEQVCGEPLREGGVPARLRAQVWLPSRPAKKKLFDRLD